MSTDTAQPVIWTQSIHRVRFLLALALAYDLLAQPPYSLRTTLTDLGRTLSRADSDILGRAARPFAQISASLAGMQRNEIARTFCSAFA